MPWHTCPRCGSVFGWRVQRCPDCQTPWPDPPQAPRAAPREKRSSLADQKPPIYRRPLVRDWAFWLLLVLLLVGVSSVYRDYTTVNSFTGQEEFTGGDQGAAFTVDLAFRLAYYGGIGVVVAAIRRAIQQRRSTG